MILPLPLTLYAGVIILGLGTVYNLFNWNTVRYYLQCTYPEQSARVTELMFLNQFFCALALLSFATAPLFAKNILEAYFILILAIPMALMSWLFYKIFSQLHKITSRSNEEVS